MAGQNIGNLKVSIGANTKDLARGIGRAKALMGSLARAAKVTGVAAGAAFAAASAGMVAMTKGGLEAVDAQAKMARSVDGTIDGLRALQIAGSDAGVAVSEMNGAVQMMGKRLAEAAREGTGPAADALKMLGLDARELMEMDVDARFGAIADRINDMGLSAQDAAGVMREFGVRSNEVSLALLQGSGAIRAARGEVQKFGLSMSGEMAAGVEAANDAMSRIGFVFEGMRNQLAVQLAPVLQGLAVNFQEASQAGGPLQNAVSMLVGAFSDLATVLLDPAFIEAATLFGVTIANAVSGLARFMVTLAENAEIAGTAMIALGGAMAFFSGPIGLAIAAVAGGAFLLSTRLGESATAADEAALAEARLQAALDLVDRTNDDAVASGEALIATRIDQARSTLEAAKAELALVRAREKAGSDLLDQNPLTAGGNSGYAEAMVENTAKAEAELAAAEAQLERYQKMLEGFKRSQFPSQGTGANSRDEPSGTAPGTPSEGDPLGVKKLNEELAKLIGTIDPATARADKFREAMQLVTKAKQAGIISGDEYILRAKQIKEAFGELPESTSAAAAGIGALNSELEKSPAAQMAEDVEAAVGNLINRIDSGKEALKQFGVALIKMFAIRGVSKILGGDDWLTGSLIGKNALGTDNWRGGLSWVGEKGPELVNLPMGAQVIPNNKIGQIGGGGMSFSYAPKIDARGASLQAVQELDQRMRADAAQFNAKVEQAVMKAKSGRKL
ncbi:hypothetical protein KUV26_16915 [Leisingera daeponensis]|uniref:Uncharacterized protein n=1 Tax=Leisingera daeponensis TaxID=405746 RepID=A0ABS7NIU6_9RHOB|nr:hypothetical protein [Leisingera daeponensis]MBY6141120.1 hypothetical protein [Leisingera daeponensis]